MLVSSGAKVSKICLVLVRLPSSALWWKVDLIPKAFPYIPGLTPKSGITYNIPYLFCRHE